MSLNLFAQDEGFWRQLAHDLAEEGMAVVPSVRLPNTFQPPMSDVIFLLCDGGIELYLDARIRYIGHSAIWRQIQVQPAIPGPARLVALADPDAAAAFRLLRTLLLDAGGALVELDEPTELSVEHMAPGEPDTLAEILSMLATDGVEQEDQSESS